MTAPSRRILFVGDTSFGETYQERMARSGATNFLQAEGYGYSLRLLSPLLKSADLVVANLETPVTARESSPLDGRKQYVHRGHPEHAPATLAAHGIRVVSLANNHAMDFGAPGLADTVAALGRVEIESFGAGAAKREAAEPWIRSLKVGQREFRLGVLAGYEKRVADERLDTYATADRPGTNRWTAESAAGQVRALRAAEPDAFIVAFPHWGENYRWRMPGQQRIAQSLIQAGADLILGHGAHMLQEIERHEGRLVVYGLGNFVFNSPGRYERFGVRPFSMAAALDVSPTAEGWNIRLRLYPIYSDNQMTAYQPNLVADEELFEIHRLLVKKTAGLADEMTTGRDDVGGYLELRLR